MPGIRCINISMKQASIHTFYQEKAKSESIDIEKSINFAIELEESVPLQSLEIYERLNQDSMFRNVNF